MSEVSRSVKRYLTEILGEQDTGKYLEFITAEPSLYLRVNKLKTTREALQKRLKEIYDIETAEVPDIPFALKVTKGNEKAGKTLEHIIGDYYIQGLSSMIPPIIASPNGNDKVLDLAAAPGSKTTELGELMNNKGVLIANEISLDRVKMLVYNLDRMNIVNYGVLHFKGELLSKVYTGYFDKILVDAPCSGLGIIQKKGEVNEWWSKEKAESLGELQTRLLIAAVKMLKTEGELIYSTCTLTVEENELVLDKILRKYPVELIPFELPVKSHEAFTKYEGRELNPTLIKARRIIPWEADSDGFFIARLRKTDETYANSKMDIRQTDLKLLSSTSKEIKVLLNNITDEFGIPADILNEYRYMKKGSDLFFVSSEWEGENLSLFERIGTKFGVIDKNSRITFHTQAAQILQNYITRGIYDIQDVDDLKRYMEGGIIKKDAGLKGQCVTRFSDKIIGSAIITEAGIKSRFPRSKRTQTIIY
jgi:NOL1/NOP2/sun family putative RNA methylase